MAVNFRDPIDQRIYDNRHFFDKKVKSLTDREVKWVQSYLYGKWNVNFYSLGSNSPHEKFIRRLAEQEDFREVFYNAYNKMQYKLLPEEYFEWIKNNIRAQIFILEILSKKNNYYTNDIYGKNYIYAIYNFFDYNDNRLYKNRIILDGIKKLWLTVRSVEKYSEWLKENDFKKISWANNYLSEKGLLIKSANNFTSIKEKREKILVSLDLIDIDAFQAVIDKESIFEEIANKTIIIDKMKRAWSQQKYRDAGKTKKPYHLPLTKKTKARLEKMAQVQGLSETAMLDILVNRFYELDYVDVDGKDLY